MDPFEGPCHFCSQRRRRVLRGSYLILDPIERTHRLIDRLARRHGFSYATEAAIGRMIDRTERTVRRHLRALEAAGAIRIERPNRSAANRIVVVSSPDRVRSDVRSGVRSHAVSRVRSHKETVSPTERSTTRTPPKRALNATQTLPSVAIAPGVLSLVEKIVERGVAVRVAHQLVTEHDAAAIEVQIVALEWRKPRDVAATLVTAIRESWSQPATLLDVIARREKKAASEAAERAQRDRDDAEAAKLEKTRLEAAERLDSMPLADRAALEARARAEVRSRTASFIATDSIVFSRMVAAKIGAVLAESGSRAMGGLP